MTRSKDFTLLLKTLLPVCVVSTVAFASWAQANQGGLGVVTPEFRRFYVPWDSRDYTWATVPWTVDDRAYQESRLQIDHQLAGSVNGLTLVNKYDGAALASPNDPLAQFRWGYAYYHWMTNRNKDVMLTKEWRNGDFILHAIDEAPSPKNYEYTRLRFLLLAWRYRRQELIPVGERLLKRNPNDAEVKFRLIHVMANTSNNAKQRQQALVYASDLIRENPTVPKYRAVTGWLYYRLWNENHDRAYAEKAVAEYNNFLRLAKPDDFFRNGVKSQITTITAELARQGK